MNMKNVSLLYAFLFLLSGEAKEGELLKKSKIENLKMESVLETGLKQKKWNGKEFEMKSASQKMATKTKWKGRGDCSAGGQELIYSHNFSSSPLNISNNIEIWFKKSLPYINKKPMRKCPKQCRQENSYQVFSKIYPRRVKKGSCKGKEAKELYSFEKTFLSLKKDVEKNHRDMMDWLLRTFVYPFFPIFVRDSSPEAVKSKISSACPSCSFYLDYNYKYIEGKGLDLVIKAHCGDIKKLISSFKFEFTLLNNWKCGN